MNRKRDADKPEDSTKRESSERDQTDASLRTERAQTDRALAERQQAIEDEADSVISVARHNADAVLDAAREKADERLDDLTEPTSTRAALTEERVAEDAAVRAEREAADENLRREREETARTLRSLIPFERAKTDRHLLTERALWDDAVSNRDDFLGIVSHDLRGLLSGIVVAAGLLSAKAPAGPEGQYATAQAERIQRYAARMSRLIGDLVDVTSIEAGKLAIAPSPSDAVTVMTEAVETFEGTATAKGVQIELRFDKCPLDAVFDPSRILQVMTNLVSNAVKFTPAGGRIVVRGEAIGSGLRLSVSDTGPGVPEEQLEAMFERFWQVQTGDQRGLGLGLYISRCIVDAHHGRIWAESRGGSGTTIYLTLPGEYLSAT